MKLRHHDKDHWMRLKFEQAAGISLSKMEEAYGQIYHRLLGVQSKADEVFSAINPVNPGNAEECYERIDQIFSEGVIDLGQGRWHSFAERHRNNERYHHYHLAAVREKKRQKKVPPVPHEPLKKCAHCDKDKKITCFNRIEWEKDKRRKCIQCRNSELSARRQMEEQQLEATNARWSYMMQQLNQLQMENDMLQLQATELEIQSRMYRNANLLDLWMNSQLVLQQNHQLLQQNFDLQVQVQVGLRLQQLSSN